MLSAFQARRAEEKLGAIFDRVGAIRSRLNRLAWQTAVFGVLAWLIGCAALVFLAAYFAPPLAFLALFVVLLATLVGGLLWTGRIAWREHATTARAAAVADERAGLKGRLRTIVELGRRDSDGARARPEPAEAMWSYLVEDTLARSDQYEPNCIERRRLSRAFYGLLASLLIVALATPLILGARKARLARAQNSQIAFNLNDLRLRSDNPGTGQGLELRGDARTRRMLRDMIGSQRAPQGQKSSSSLDRLLNHARSLADRLQDKLTGRSHVNRGLKLKVADASRLKNPLDNNRRMPSFEPSPSVRPRAPAGKPRQRDRSAADSMHLPPLANPHGQTRKQKDAFGGRPQAHASKPKKGEGTRGKSNSDKMARSGMGKHDARSGSSHGIGTDEANLFGRAGGKPKPGAPGFEIAIQAEPGARGSKSGGETYVPPTVDTPLNTQQHRDEPIPRASIPEQDRAAIRSVFER